MCIANNFFVSDTGQGRIAAVITSLLSTTSPACWSQHWEDRLGCHHTRNLCWLLRNAARQHTAQSWIRFLVWKATNGSSVSSLQSSMSCACKENREGAPLTVKQTRN